MEHLNHLSLFTKFFVQIHILPPQILSNLQCSQTYDNNSAQGINPVRIFTFMQTAGFMLALIVSYVWLDYFCGRYLRAVGCLLLVYFSYGNKASWQACCFLACLSFAFCLYVFFVFCISCFVFGCFLMAID